MVYGHGAFELCLPSLGILYQICYLRYAILGRTPKTKRTRGEDHQIATVRYPREPTACEHYRMSDGSALRASLEVDAIQPVGACDTQYGHKYVESYVVYWLHTSMYTVQDFWCVWFGCGGW